MGKGFDRYNLLSDAFVWGCADRGDPRSSAPSTKLLQMTLPVLTIAALKKRRLANWIALLRGDRSGVPDHKE